MISLWVAYEFPMISYDLSEKPESEQVLDQGNGICGNPFSLIRAQNNVETCSPGPLGGAHSCPPRGW